MKLPEELRGLYDEGRLVPFLGAGISRSIEWKDSTGQRHGPLWSEVVDESARLLGFNDPELLRLRGSHLQVLEYFKETQGLGKLKNWLFSSMQPPDDALRDSPIFRELAALSKCRLMYTTNFDNFLERALVLAGTKTKVIAGEADMGRAAEPGTVEVVKFHGDFDHPKEMVLTESDYQRRLEFTTALDFRFRSDLLGRAVLFLGYSFNDPNVSYLFHLVDRQLSRLQGTDTGHRAYITVPDPSNFERTLFRSRKITVLPITGRDQIVDVASLLQDLRGDS